MAPEQLRDESEGERLDRQLAELLQELRVVLPGVQVLFAFLLTVPFTSRFGDITDFQRGVYVFVLLSTAVATVLLMAPTALHRLLICGGAVLGLAVSAAVFLVMDVVYGRAAGLVAGLATLALIIAMWVILPLSGRRPGGAPPQ
jgi:hypothetical protein